MTTLVTNAEKAPVYVWRDIPDPRPDAGPTCEIRFDDERWTHVVTDRRHLTKESPWSELLGTYHSQLAALDTLDRDKRIELLTQVMDVLEHELRPAFEKPLVLLFDLRDPGRSKRSSIPHWSTVGQSGLLVYGRWTQQAGCIRTCFFSNDVLHNQKSVLPLASWLVQRRALVETYAEHINGEFHCPSPQRHVVDRYDGTRRRRVKHGQIWFVDQRTWGFDHDGRWNPRLGVEPTASPTGGIDPFWRRRPVPEESHD